MIFPRPADSWPARGGMKEKLYGRHEQKRGCLEIYGKRSDEEVVTFGAEVLESRLRCTACYNLKNIA